MKRLMSIDASINNCGIAIWDVPKKEVIMYKLLHPEKGLKDDEFDKSISMLRQIRHWKKIYVVDGMILEVPEQWAVAGFQARETGSMTKLMFVCGMICSICEDQDLEEFQIVVPREWKGQLGKKIMCARLASHYLKQNINLYEIDSNIVDAVGIGHYRLYGRV